MLLRAFAKINLDLRVLGRRADGFHEVRTILQTVDWCDEVHIRRADAFSFLASGGPHDETNLVVRAVREFEKASGIKVNAEIHLEKNIPEGAGLGGGSADAAVTFLGLQRFCRRPLPPAQVVRSLRNLGADVPFFAVGGRAAGIGRGDEVIPLEDDGNYFLLLVGSSVHIDTTQAYSWLTPSDKSNNIEGFYAHFMSRRAGQQWVNTFEAPVFKRFPELASIKEELLRSGAYHAALTGSGASLFGRYRSRAEASRAAEILGRSFTVKLTKPLPRSEYFQRIIKE